MAGVIDKNVVQMVFDNLSFEKNAEESLNTIQKLKDALNFEGAARGLTDIAESAKAFSMDAVTNGVAKAKGEFDVFEIAAIRAIQNVTDRVQQLGQQLLSSITTKPLQDGFSEYELQMTSVQTITSSTGESIATVNKYLDELNTYADKTIYSFSDMTQNIGKFTNSGVKLEDAVKAIQGISNEAAISGANTNEASRAMYNFAQALSTGAVKLIDWKSIENANMATMGFKEQLIDTATAMGTLVKQGDKYVSTTVDMQGKVSDAFTASKGFNDSLSAQWMTTDVLVETLSHYSTDVREMTKQERDAYKAKLEGIGYTKEQIKSIMELGSKSFDAAQDVKTFSQLIDTVKEALGSGWTKTWQYVFGDLNEAKRLWTGVNQVISGFIDKTADARNSVLREWSRAGYIFTKEGEVFKAVYDEEGYLDEEKSKELVKNGKLIREEMGGRELVYEGLKKVYESYAEVFTEFSDAFKTNFIGIDNKAISDLSITGQKLKDLSLRFYDFATAIRKSITRNDKDEATGILADFRQHFLYLASNLRIAYDGITKALSGIKNVFSAFFKSSFFSNDFISPMLTGILAISYRIREFGEFVDKQFGGKANNNGLVEFFNGIQKALTTVNWIQLDVITNVIDSLFKVVEHLIGPGKTLGTILGDIGGKIGTFSDALFKMTHETDNVSKFEKLFKDLVSSFNKFVDTIKGAVNFSGFAKMFDNLMSALTSNKVDAFRIVTDAINSIVNVLKAFLSIASPVAAAFANVFGDSITKAVMFVREIADRIRAFTESLIANKETMMGVQALFTGIFSVVKALAMVVGNVLIGAWDALANIFKNVLPSGQSLGATLTNIGGLLQKLASVIKSLVGGKDGAPKLAEIIASIGDGFGKFYSKAKDIHILESVADVFHKIGDGIKHALGGSEDASLLDVLIEKIGGFLDKIKTIFNDSEGKLDLVKVFEAGGIGYLLTQFFDFVTKVSDNVHPFQKIADILNDFKDTIGDAIENIGNSFKSASVKMIAASLLEIAAALFILSMIDTVALAQSMVAMALIFKMIEKLLVVMNSFDKSAAANIGASAGALFTLGQSLLMIAVAVKLLGSMDFPELVQGMGAVAIMILGLTKVMEQLSGNDRMMKGAGGLIAMALALDLLVIPIKVLGGMDYNSLVNGLGSVMILMAELTGAAYLLSTVDTKGVVKAGFAMIELAVALRLITPALVDMAAIPWPDLGKGLAVFAVALVGMVGFAAIVSKAKISDELLALGTSLVMLGASMVMISTALQGIGAMSPEDLGKGFAVFAVALIALGIASKKIDGNNLLKIGGALFLVATAISELSLALNLAQVLGPLATSLAAGINGIKDSLVAFSAHAAASAFLEFLQNLILFLPKLVVGLVTSIGDLLVALGASAGKIAVAVAQIGKGILQAIQMLMPEVFTILMMYMAQFWVFLNSQVPEFFNFLTTVFTSIGTFVMTNGPMIFEVIKTLIMSFFSSLLEIVIVEVPKLGEAFIAIMSTALNIITTMAPQIGEAFLAVLTTLLNVVQTAAPAISETLLTLLLTLFQQLAAFVPQMAQAGLEIVLGFLNAIRGNIGELVQAGIEIALGFISGVTESMPQITDAAFKLIIGFIDGLASAIENNHQALFAAVGHLIQAIFEAIVDGIRTIADGAGQLISGFLAEFDLGKIGGTLASAGMNLVQGVINGIQSFAQNLWNEVSNLAQGALNALTGGLQEHSPSKAGYKAGAYLAIGVGNGVADAGKDTIQQVGTMAYGMLDALSSLDDADSFKPTIAPVFDASSIQNGINTTLRGVNAIVNGSAEINGTIDADKQLKNQIAQIAASENDYSSIISVMNNLRKDLATYNETLSKTQIVMDSGTLVGALISEIDNQLGFRSVMAQRGVY